jgi:dolichyl-phosphate-mannose-protein mannosyltransferase
MAKKKILPPNVVTVKKKEQQLQQHPDLRPGRKWRYFTTSVDEETLSLTQLTRLDYGLIAIAIALSLSIKTHGINKPSVVLFDETHTIRHINKYIDGLYFNDVTPPLHSLVYTFIAYLVGYRGDKHLKAGDDYALTTVPYVALRVFTSVLSSLNVPLCYLTLRACAVSSLVAFASTVLLCLETMIVLSSRIFIPDTLFLLGLSLSVYSYKRFDITVPFGKSWFKYLLLTGISMGLTISTKWIGLATVTWVLSLALIKVWFILGDLQVSNCQATKHTLFRSSLVIIPFAVYFMVFIIHIKLLPQYHKDASLLSTHFQRDLVGNDLSDVPKYVTWGSTITIRHTDSMGGYLHSHPYKYKSGSRNQQVTVFDYKDFNNEWVLEPVRGINSDDLRIRRDAEAYLRHKMTGALLRVDNSKPPISEQEYDFEVSCFGNGSYTGNDTDIFRIKFSSDDMFLRSTDMKFWLYNGKKKCTILSHDLKLPSWGFNQQEVICIESPNMDRATFSIENVKYPEDLGLNETLQEKLENQPPSVLFKFAELNGIMNRLLKGIKMTNDKIKEPTTWPLMKKGEKFLNHQDSLIYMIGNPVIAYITLIFISVSLIVSFISLFKGDYSRRLINYRHHSLTFILGWVLHYVPYLLIQGEYFIQYYIPALYFGILLLGVTFQYLLSKNKNFGILIMATSVLLSYYFFSSISPLIYGTKWTEDKCESMKWLNWDFSCDNYDISI